MQRFQSPCFYEARLTNEFKPILCFIQFLKPTFYLADEIRI